MYYSYSNGQEYDLLKDSEGKQLEGEALYAKLLDLVKKQVKAHEI